VDILRRVALHSLHVYKNPDDYQPGHGIQARTMRILRDAGWVTLGPHKLLRGHRVTITDAGLAALRSHVSAEAYDILAGFAAQLADDSTTCRCLKPAVYWRTYERYDDHVPFCAACKEIDQNTTEAREFGATYTPMENTP
jgi:hypothetical protein